MKRISFCALSGYAAAGLAAALMLGTAAPVAQADAISDFYKIKGLRVIVGSGAGGGYDTYTRSMMRHYNRHVPGKPRVVVQNMPGASGIRATNYVYAKAPKDGSVFMATYQALLDENLLGNRKAKFDVRKMGWIGSVGKTHHLCVTWHTSPIKDIRQAIGKKLTVSATGRSGNSATVPLMLNQTLGTKFQVIVGYSTTGSRLALERGEVDAICGLGLSTLRASNPGWFINKKINVIGQIGLKRHAEFPNIVNAVEMVKKEDRGVYEFFGVAQEMGRPYVAPPGMPAEKLKVLRTAFNATMKDKAFLKDMKRLRLSVNPLTGQEMEQLIAKLYTYPQPILNRVAELIGVAKKERTLACKKIAKNPKKQCKKKKKKKTKSS
jgi:tripartite-type tricarboxylate transporter receptor subunit TctC